MASFFLPCWFILKINSFIINCHAAKNKAYFAHCFLKLYQEIFLVEYVKLFVFAANHFLYLFAQYFDIHSQMILFNMSFKLQQCFIDVELTAYHQSIRINLNVFFLSMIKTFFTLNYELQALKFVIFFSVSKICLNYFNLFFNW
jgi:hypothetical protein